jgi:uncharacterized protein
MLIEFKATNFRSIREEQTFSLVASNAVKDMDDCLTEHQLPGLSGLRFLKGAAIYGANASGKSNLIEAIHFLQRFVRNSATKIHPGDPTGTEPFKLDQDSTDKPSEFEVTFVTGNIRYVYGVSLTRERVTEEYLFAYPKGSPQRWFHRTYNVEQKIYEWAKPSIAFKQDKSLQDKTRENSLFLSVGPQFNHDQLTIVFNWFKKELRFITLDADAFLHPGFTAEMLEKPENKMRILNLLKSADFGVTDARTEERDLNLDDLKENIPPAILAEIMASGGNAKARRMEISLIHQAENINPVAMDFDDEESAGTRRFFSLAGPWLDILDNGYTVFIDEIETSLHPVLVRELLKLLFCSRNNTKGAQVIFTTHNPFLLDNSLIRRDQVWFTEKTPEGATHLYPLTDYKPRKDEALAKGYLAGRYGAIPFLPEGLQL